MEPARDVAIVGGGLAGILAAKRLAEHKKLSVTLIDSAIPAADGKLGGFAKFSGAKFSKLPAGQGLIEVAGGMSRLELLISEAIDYLGLTEKDLLLSQDTKAEPKSANLALRSYLSILLKPHEVDEMIVQSTRKINERVEILRNRVSSVELDDQFCIRFDNGKTLRARNVLVSTGRSGSNLLKALGAEEQDGKGVDFGVRLEFDQKDALRGLRKLGPDAKIILRNTRTFCLNHPGEVYRYPFDGILIPGGVVADCAVNAANVGILLRAPEKRTVLPRILSRLKEIPEEKMLKADLITGVDLGETGNLVEYAFGPAARVELDAFLQFLDAEELVDFQVPHRAHFPLMDWHWPVFAVGKSHRTSVSGLYVAGDSAGHARGLLQAAVSGLIAADEMVRDYGN